MRGKSHQEGDFHTKYRATSWNLKECMKKSLPLSPLEFKDKEGSQ
ncbi:hypothetical protein Gotur_007018 [Gossypium turneri]